ncbi:MAG TPA: amino acid adenylation domain-containing protein [Pyrinomonadaceae bacterium]|jgi:aspartate racemase
MFTQDDLRERKSRLSQAKRILFERRVRGQFAIERVAIPKRRKQDYVPLSFAQQRLWFLNQMEPDSSAYNLRRAVRIIGTLNLEALQQTLDALVERHEALRTNFQVVGGNPVQVIAENRSLEMAVVDLRAQPRDETEIENFLRAESQRAFNLSEDLLIRATLLRLREDEHILLIVMHHIVSDLWSNSILLRDFAALYESLSTGRPAAAAALGELPIQYADFAVWQRDWLQGEVLDEQLSYWKQQLGGHDSATELPTDHPRPPIRSFRGERLYSIFPVPLLESLRALSRREGVTLYMTLLAAFQALLYRYTGEEEITVGSPIANRTRAELEGVVGFFLNTLVLRTNLSGDPTFTELLRRVREVALGAYAHQDLPFEKLVEELQLERKLERNPLFNIAVNIPNTHLPVLELPGLTLVPLEFDMKTAKFDLTLFMEELPQGLKLYLEYSTDLFEPTTIKRLMGHFQTLLEAVTRHPELRLSELPVLTEAERGRLLVEWNETATPYPAGQCVHHLFEAQVESSPEAVAIVCEEGQMTYDELNRKANQLAHYLRGKGTGPEALVGILVERSPEMVLGLLGILKAGSAYVALDPVYPVERLSLMIKDAGIRVLITQERLLEKLPVHEAEVICLDTDWSEISEESAANLESEAGPDNLAYVAYTSGSTGVPKGVMISHRNIVRLVKNTGYASLTADEVFLQFAPASFDASTFEIWGSLLNGARLAVFPACAGAVPSLEELGRFIRQYGVTTLWLTAGLFHLMVENRLEDLRGVRQLLAGGDVLSPAHAERAVRELKGCRLINGYGPTENTTFTCCYTLTDAGRACRSLPIGRAVANTEVYILDPYLNPVPVGVPGELYVGGDGLARGYLNRAQLTAEKFIPHPFGAQAGARLYKTGDRARYMADGNIEFLGRLDRQVKIRGFRVEPGEVEAALTRHAGVRECTVQIGEEGPGGKRLVAYIVPCDQAQSRMDELRSFLRRTLPEYLIPSAFVMLDALPLTPGGKIDPLALPAPEENGPQTTHGFVAPRSPLEETLADIWASILKTQWVGIRDNFFELGGHSLLATQVISRLRDHFNLELPLRTIFERPTVEELAAIIVQCRDEQAEELEMARMLAELESLSDEDVRRILSEEAGF